MRAISIRCAMHAESGARGPPYFCFLFSVGLQDRSHF